LNIRLSSQFTFMRGLGTLFWVYHSLYGINERIYFVHFNPFRQLYRIPYPLRNYNSPLNQELTHEWIMVALAWSIKDFFRNKDTMASRQTLIKPLSALGGRYKKRSFSTNLPSSTRTCQWGWNRANKLLGCDSPCPATVDANLVRIVTRNLLQNAIKYSPRASEVEAALTMADGIPVLEILDRGRGLPKGVFEGLLGGATVSSTFGTQGEHRHGIGLAVCLELLRAGGGSLHATRGARRATPRRHGLPSSY